MVASTEAWRMSWSGLASRSVRALEDDDFARQCQGLWLLLVKQPCNARRVQIAVPERIRIEGFSTHMGISHG